MPESSGISLVWRSIFSKASCFVCNFICEYFLKTFGIALSQELRNPLVGDTACTEARRILELIGVPVGFCH